MGHLEIKRYTPSSVVVDWKAVVEGFCFDVAGLVEVELFCLLFSQPFVVFILWIPCPLRVIVRFMILSINAASFEHQNST